MPNLKQFLALVLSLCLFNQAFAGGSAGSVAESGGGRTSIGTIAGCLPAGSKSGMTAWNTSTLSLFNQAFCASSGTLDVAAQRIRTAVSKARLTQDRGGHQRHRGMLNRNASGGQEEATATGGERADSNNGEKTDSGRDKNTDVGDGENVNAGDNNKTDVKGDKSADSSGNKNGDSGRNKLVETKAGGQKTKVENPTQTGTSVTVSDGGSIAPSEPIPSGEVTTVPAPAKGTSSPDANLVDANIAGTEATVKNPTATPVNVTVEVPATEPASTEPAPSGETSAEIIAAETTITAEIEPTQPALAETTNPDALVGLADATNDPNAANSETPLDSTIDALEATIASANLNVKLANLNVAALFQENKLYHDGTGQLWQGTSAVVKTGVNNIQFVNAGQQAGKQDLSYHLTDMIFNTAIPSDYTQATSQAMRSLNNTLTPPTYFLTTVTTERGHSSGTLTAFDKLNLTATGGTSSFNAAAGEWQTGFASQSASITPAGGAAVTLYTQTSLGTTYLGVTAPTVTVTQITGGYQITNTYADANNTKLTQTVLHVDANNNPVSTTSPGSTASLDYLKNVVVTKDDIACNRFVNGAMTTLTSENIRILSGLDSILNNTDANNLLKGAVPSGVPAGFFTK